MKKKSLQKIEDFYVSKGYKESGLRKILEKDKEYQKLLKKRKQKLTKKFKVNLQENKKYVLSTDSDFEILNKCKQLEKLKLCEEERILVKLIKTQLEDDWRKPLIITLNRLSKKHQKNFCSTKDLKTK